MARYHFHIYNSVGFVEDEEGRELPDLDAVRREGVKGIRSLLSEEVTQGHLDLRGRLDVADGDGSVVLTLPFHQTVDLYLDDEPPGGGSEG
jgi:hypothetical protein